MMWVFLFKSVSSMQALDQQEAVSADIVDLCGDTPVAGMSYTRLLIDMLAIILQAQTFLAHMPSGLCFSYVLVCSNPFA